MIRTVAALSAAALLAACGGNRESRTVVVVTAHLSASSIAGMIDTLKVTVGSGALMDTHEYGRTGKALTFPTTFGIELPAMVTGAIRVDVIAENRSGATVAAGGLDRVEVVPKKTVAADVWLGCVGPCPGDGGVPDAGVRDARTDLIDAGPGCGNARVDPGETCDTAILRGRPGACAATCDDGIPCTNDSRVGSGCAAECVHTEIRATIAGDRCCPTAATRTTDSDCSATCGNGAIETGETCDLRLERGKPGACPSALDCGDREACTMDILISAMTCSAVCVRRPISALVAGDGCCPAGATNQTDSDCPVVCGNGILEPGEVCDMGIAANTPGGCPTACKDENACTMDVLQGAGCMRNCRFNPITTFTSGDGCCPRGGNSTVDADCGAICGNALLESGESCDNRIAAGMPGACPTSCPPEAGCMPRVLQGVASACTARCVAQPITTCKSAKDSCCPSGCTGRTDPDCSLSCGDGLLAADETCDTAIPMGQPGVCPTIANCDDGNPCTADAVTSPGTCSARCASTPITTTISGDKCCPPGANHNVDKDCPAVCGNSVVEAPAESCDSAIGPGGAGACPSSCPPPAACRRYLYGGAAAMCTSQCTTTTVTACIGSDDCCPVGCNRTTDADCSPVCGNAVVEPGEACDRGLTAGNKGACQASCDDNDACTSETTAGSIDDCTRTCTYTNVTACNAGDGCCPMGCTGQTDSDCTAVCGNNATETGESCDPPSSCPTTCPDDGDTCTTEKLTGGPTTCNAACTSAPVTACSGQTTDLCCPTGCTVQTDADCLVALPVDDGTVAP